MCDTLAADRRGLSSGLPDLILWRVVEVPVSTVGGKSVISIAHAYESGDALGIDAVDLRIPSGASGIVKVEVAFIEVKGPGDVLSDKQRVGLRLLWEAGVDARVLSS